MPRPVLLVLAGVNGAGKSSIGGHLLARAGLAWYNPDDYAREVMSLFDCTQAEANGVAWTEGMRRLDAAIASGRSFAFETTLGGKTVAGKIAAAASTHDVDIWYCGLATPELHIERVALRVSHGGHAINEQKIRERIPASLLNLIRLMPHAWRIQVLDNSLTVASGEAIADPVRVLTWEAGRLVYPKTPGQLRSTPDWAKPLVEAAMDLDSGPA